MEVVSAAIAIILTVFAARETAKLSSSIWRRSPLRPNDGLDSLPDSAGHLE
jgi:hypothetical protein